MHKIISISLLTALMVLSAAAAAMAFGEIRYTDRPLNLRNGRSAKAKWVGSLYAGQKVRVAYERDGWVAIFEPGETRNTEKAAVGYSNAKYLKKKRTRHEPKPWGEMVYAGRNLNVRTLPSTKGKKVRLLAADERVIVDFPEDDWTMVFSPDATIRSKMNALGYSSAKFFEPVTDDTPAPMEVAQVSEPVPSGSTGGNVAPPPAPKPAPKVEAPTQPAPVKAATSSWGTVVTLKRKVNMRAERTTSSKLKRTLQVGERVRVDYFKNGWYAVFKEDELIRSEKRAIGYVLRSLLEEQPSVENVVAAGKGMSAPAGGIKKTMVIDRNRFSGAKRPDPVPNKNAHGYQYKLMEKSETKKYGETWITMKIFLSTTKLPGTTALVDFAKTLWRENKRTGKNLAVLIYLPGQDTDDLSYGVVQFTDKDILEMWIRKTTLFGTKFL
ncbi:SH3 domain-containing protein [Pseudodesulfovibrio sp. zrk46]|uniref:SH3 domain-containing protein n=1 Tax=Pseudodesulfovibrio sp. zrk46 TaxID=2725288 RepID=UPI001448FDA1|nr:SH3 domain-containing protein [Pseudodesulfovibrio sp. zrk46]QJB54919.1 SH3 domain-containing protein [Pseudodesulfovibrio sp. zrk46]